MTRRYNLSHAVGQPMPEDWLDLPDSVVAAADYDAISARLVEAEKDRDRLRGLIALCVTQAEARGSTEFAKVLRGALRVADSASTGEKESL